MGTLYANKSYLEVLLKLGKAYKVPVMLNQQIVQNTGITVGENTVMINSIYVENPADFEKGAAAYYTRILQNQGQGTSALAEFTEPFSIAVKLAIFSEWATPRSSA